MKTEAGERTAGHLILISIVPLEKHGIPDSMGHAGNDGERISNPAIQKMQIDYLTGPRRRRKLDRGLLYRRRFPGDILFKI